MTQRVRSQTLTFATPVNLTPAGLEPHNEGSSLKDVVVFTLLLTQPHFHALSPWRHIRVV